MIDTGCFDLITDAFKLHESMFDFFDQPFLFTGPNLIGRNLGSGRGFDYFKRPGGAIAFADMATFNQVVDVQGNSGD